jgi:ABC-type cobalamin/Fe3+-siderophores transport system ATPase subunit
VLDVCTQVILLDKGEICTRGGALEILSDKNLLNQHSLEVPPSLKYNSRPAVLP